MADALKRADEVVRRARTQLRRAARDLTAIQAALEATAGDRFGSFRLAPGEPIDETELLSYLRRARREHPEQVLVIAVQAHDRA
jgi:hypothetical protein